MFVPPGSVDRREWRLNPKEEDYLFDLVEKKFPVEYHLAQGENPDGSFIDDDELFDLYEQGFEEEQPIFSCVGELERDYCLAHMDEFVAMVENSNTYAELRTKWEAFYEQIPVDKMIIKCL